MKVYYVNDLSSDSETGKLYIRISWSIRTVLIHKDWPSVFPFLTWFEESDNGLSNEAKRLEDEAKVAMADAQRQAEFNLQLMKR